MDDEIRRKATPRIGVLAFGSLLDDAGELDAVTVDRVPAKTPFSVEFGRSSRGRDGGPTLIPVEEGGAKVRCEVLLLRPDVSIQDARNRLYRRETNQVGSHAKYVAKVTPSLDEVLIAELRGFAGCDVVLYTSIGKNIHSLNPSHFADLAITSAAKGAGTKKRDGISYLIAAKRHEIVTPLSTEYEAEILRKTGAPSLDEAWRACRSTDNSPVKR